MTPSQFVVSLMCLSLAQMNDLSSSVRQESGFIATHVGRSIILQCFYDNDMVTRYYWYKQNLGEKPRLMATFYTYNKKDTFYDEYENNPRFTLDTENGKNHLRISDLRTSDSATYYCASSYSVAFEFGEGATVSVKGSGLNIQALVHQSGSDTIQPGGSVTLSCTVHTGTCDGEHSVYWFKDSEESHPGLIYTHGDRNDQCERKPETQTQTCVYNLPMQSLNLSHAGTYYCAVASCGHILFGNGTKLDFEDEDSLVYLLSGALGFSTILNVLLAFSVCVISMRGNCLCTESSVRFSDPSKNNAEGSQNEDEDVVYYIVLKDNEIRRRRLKDTWSECVYFSVKQQS
ncbi:immunoglobulin kappa light chain-like isoform X2 [Seriola aureovittata]|uniref:immunoglobulin kappa light chain-like isoform X2 n=1 Tax=Seriola aureovittata TaxID=2871759 RepID=UPI0024BD618E|nr:immunoglobulin kappa light chain-like isoform X2 [Seriola aureovittata]